MIQLTYAQLFIFLCLTKFSKLLAKRGFLSREPEPFCTLGWSKMSFFPFKSRRWEKRPQTPTTSSLAVLQNVCIGTVVLSRLLNDVTCVEVFLFIFKVTL